MIDYLGSGKKAVASRSVKGRKKQKGTGLKSGISQPSYKELEVRGGLCRT